MLETELESRLNPSEKRVLVHLLDGRSNVAIAEKLGLSDKTVKNHISHIYIKTGTTSRLDLVTRIYKARLRALRRSLKTSGLR